MRFFDKTTEVHNLTDKETLRKIGTKIICLCFVFQMIFVIPISAAYTPEVSAYNNYYRKYLYSKVQYPYGDYILHDINKDGIKEMFFEYMSGTRYGFKIYTFKNGKVKCVKTFRGVSCIGYKGNRIVVLQSGGAANNTYTIYTFDGDSLKKQSEYKSVAKYNVATGRENVKFYGNNKNISRNAYLKKSDSLLKWKRIMVNRSL